MSEGTAGMVGAQERGVALLPWRGVRLGVRAALVALVALCLWGNLHWVQTNVVLVGRDAGGHLTATLDMARTLSPLSPTTLFQAIVADEYRPPALPLATQLAYALWGRTMDSAQMVNVALLVAIQGLTYLLGRRLVGRGGALLAAALVGFWPMLAGMTRLFYTENFLTTGVVLALLGLLASDGFRSRRGSLLWGLGLGIGLLVKWTAPIYLLLPTLVALWAARLPQSQVAALRRPVVAWRAVGLAVLGALLLTAGWYLPNRALALTLPLGDGLFLGWVALLALPLYLAQRPSRPLTNLWLGLGLAAAMASIWYLARPDFLDRVLDAGYGDYKGNYDPFNPWRWQNYTRFFVALGRNHFGWLPALVTLPLAGAGWWRHWQRRHGASSPLPPAAWGLLWGSLCSAYLFLSTASQDSERNLVPLVPVLVLWLVAGLRGWPRRVMVGAGALWLLVFGLQWSLFTFDRMGPLHQATAPLWATSEFLIRPASGETDPRLWIAPEVLATITSQPQQGPASFGMLVNSPGIHRGPYRYLIDAQGLPVVLTPLTEHNDFWADVLANQWVLAKDGDNTDVEPPGQASIARIFGGDALFALLYRPERRYALPDGETATLFFRPRGPAYPFAARETLDAWKPVAETIARGWAPGASLLFGDPDAAVYVGMHDPQADAVDWLPEDANLGDREGTIFVVVPHAALDQRARLAAENFHALDVETPHGLLSVYGRFTGDLPALPTGADYGDLRLEGIATQPTLRPGGVLPLRLRFAGEPGTRKASLRLIDAGGQVVAQRDVAVAPEATLGLFVPADRPPGAYTLALRLYDSATLAPIPTVDGAEEVALGTIEVGAR